MHKHLALFLCHLRSCVFESLVATYMMCVHVWQCLCKSALTLPQTTPLQGGNAERDAQFIFGSVTVCQWPQMHRKGRLWDTNRPWFVSTSHSLCSFSISFILSHFNQPLIHGSLLRALLSCTDILCCTMVYSFSLFWNHGLRLYNEFLHDMTFL